MTAGIRRSLSAAVLALAAGGALAAEPAPAKEPALAIRAAKILTVTRGVIDDGVVVVRGRKIEAVGPVGTTPVPRDARLVDCRDSWVFPGLIDLHAHIAGNGNDINDMVHPTNPELRTFETIDPDDEDLKIAVAGGVTTILYIPGSGTNLSGFGCLLKTAGDSLDDMVIRRYGAMKVAQAFNPERRAGDLGLSRMGMSWGLKQLLDRARDYTKAWDAFDAGKGEKPALDRTLEPMKGLFRREYPVIVHTAGARDVVATARMFFDEYGLWTIVTHGCFDAHKSSPDLAKRKGLFVNLGPRLFDYNPTAEGRFVAVPSVYAAAGVERISFCTDSPVVPEEELFLQAAMAVRFGFPPDRALAAVTIEPATAIGIADRTGSLEAGKDADLIVKDGDPFDPATPIGLVLVNGKPAYDPKKLATTNSPQGSTP